MARAWQLAVVVVSLLLMSTVCAAAPRLEDILYEKRGNDYIIHIILSAAVKYTSHFPANKSDKVSINIRAIDETADDINEVPGRQTLIAPTSDVIPLQEVNLNTEDEQFSLIVLFDKTVLYDVRQEHPKTITIALLGSVSDVVETLNSQLNADETDKDLRVLNEGKKALTRGEVRKAIRIFTFIWSKENLPAKQEALELLGVARERNKQYAQAKLAYRTYLKKYPEGEGASRVSQRLSGMIDALLPAKQKLKIGKRFKDKKSLSTFVGTISQYYYLGHNIFDNVADKTDLSLLVSQISTNWRIRTATYELRNFFYANHRYDLTSGTDKDIDINSMYLRYKQYKKGLYATFGRQSASTAGVLGHYDGLLVGYNYLPNIRVNAVYGYPVDVFNKSKVQTNRPFVGVNVELNDYWKNWDINPYLMLQDVDGIRDREAVGAEVRYFTTVGNMYSVLDYDIGYDDLNIFLLRGQYNILTSSSVTMSYDYRNNPLLETSNALIGNVTSDSIDGLLKTLLEDDIRDLALERTGFSTTLSIGANHSISKDVDLNVDVTQSEQTFRVVDGNNILETEKEKQNYYAIQVILKKFLNEKDATIISWRQIDTDLYDENLWSIANRYPLNRRLRFDTRLRYANRNENAGGKLQRIKPTLELDYRYTKTMRLLFELGIEWRDYNELSDGEDSKRITATLGYRWIF